MPVVVNIAEQSTPPGNKVCEDAEKFGAKGTYGFTSNEI
jgi:hypothetical protein